ncbi:hypothetical protein ACWC2K_33810 [Streptomyces chattanoogensis]
MAMQGLKLHRPEHRLGLAETGLSRGKGRVDAQTEPLFRVVHAHTLTKAGQRTAALVEAERASTLLTADPDDEVPFWALAWGPPAASVYSRNAKLYEALSDYRTAAEQYGRAACARPVASRGVARSSSPGSTMTVQLRGVSPWSLGERQVSRTEAVAA